MNCRFPLKESIGPLTITNIDLSCFTDTKEAMDLSYSGTSSHGLQMYTPNSTVESAFKVEESALTPGLISKQENNTGNYTGYSLNSSETCATSKPADQYSYFASQPRLHELYEMHKSSDPPLLSESSISDNNTYLNQTGSAAFPVLDPIEGEDDFERGKRMIGDPNYQGYFTEEFLKTGIPYTGKTNSSNSHSDNYSDDIWRYNGANDTYLTMNYQDSDLQYSHKNENQIMYTQEVDPYYQREPLRNTTKYMHRQENHVSHRNSLKSQTRKSKFYNRKFYYKNYNQQQNKREYYQNSDY